MGARREGELTAGRAWSVAGCSESPRLPAVEVPVGGGLSGALFKRPAEALRARPALAAQTCRAGLGWADAFLSAAAAAGAGPSGCGPLAPSCSEHSSPSRSLPSPRLPRSPCLSLALIFFLLPLPRRPHLGRLRPLVDSRSTPFLARSPSAGPRFLEPPHALPPARTLGSPAAGAGLAAAPQLARSLSLEQPPNAACLAEAAARRPPALPCGVQDSGRLRSRLGPQRQRRPPRPGLWAPQEPASGCRLLASPGRAGGRATDPSARRRPRPRSVSYGPRGRDRGDRALRLLGRGLRRGPRGSGRWPLMSSRAQDSQRKISGLEFLGLRVFPRGRPGFLSAPKGGNGAAAILRAWGKSVSVSGVMSGSTE